MLFLLLFPTTLSSPFLSLACQQFQIFFYPLSRNLCFAFQLNCAYKIQNKQNDNSKLSRHKRKKGNSNDLGVLCLCVCVVKVFFPSVQMNSVFVLFPFNPILHLRKLHTLKTQYRMNAISRGNGSSRCFGTSKCFFMYIYSRLSCT